MKKNLLVVACLATISVALVYGQAPAQPAKAPTAAPQPRAQAAAPQPKAAATNQAVSSATDERALVDKYCVACHNTKAKATGQKVLGRQQRRPQSTLSPRRALHI